MMPSVVPYLVGGSQLGASLPQTKEKLQSKLLQLCFLAILGKPRTLPHLKEVLNGLKRVERVFLEKLFLSSRILKKVLKSKDQKVLMSKKSAVNK